MRPVAMENKSSAALRCVAWLALLALACGIVFQSTTVIHDDESSTTVLTIAIEKTLLTDPGTARRWESLIEGMARRLEERGATVEAYGASDYGGLQASITYPDLTAASTALSGDELSLFDSFTLMRWRGEVVFEAHTTSALIRQRILQITGLHESDLLLVQFPLYLSMQFPGRLLYSNADQTEPGGVQTWTINWLVEAEYTLQASSQIPLLPPVIVEPAGGARIRDASEGVDFSGTGEPAADLTLYRGEGASRTELARGGVGADRQWKLDGVRLGAPGRYALSAEERTDHDSLASEHSTLEYRPLEPIVFVPGFYACSQGLADENGFLQWVIDPTFFGIDLDRTRQLIDPNETGLFVEAVNIYQPLFDDFIRQGYVLERDFFVACHDWTESLPNEAEDFRSTLERAWRENPAGLPVTVITHSHGGLVARYYIQRHPAESRQRISSLILIAPPNRGVTKAYYPWEGGTVEHEASVIQTLLGFTFARRCGIFPPQESVGGGRGSGRNANYDEELVEYQKEVHHCLRYGRLRSPVPYDLATAPDNGIPSVAWLLPTFPFLRVGGDDPIPYPGAPVARLNTEEGIAALFGGLEGSIGVLQGQIPNSTYDEIHAIPSPDTSPLWGLGRPTSFTRGLGDDTVLKRSTALPYAEDHAERYRERTYSGAHHAKNPLGDPTLFEVEALRRDISDLIREDFPGESDASAWSDILIVWVESPVNLLLTDARGRRAGVDSTGVSHLEIPAAAYADTGDRLGPKFIVIPNPVEGDYRFQVIGLADGEYAIYGLASSLDAPLIAETGRIAGGQQETFTAAFSTHTAAPRLSPRGWLFVLGAVVLAVVVVSVVAVSRRKRRPPAAGWDGPDPYLDVDRPRRKRRRRRQRSDDPYDGGEW